MKDFIFYLLFYFVITCSYLSWLYSKPRIDKWLPINQTLPTFDLTQTHPVILSMSSFMLQQQSSVTGAIWPAKPKVFVRLSFFPLSIFSPSVWWFSNTSTNLSTKLTPKDGAPPPSPWIWIGLSDLLNTNRMWQEWQSGFLENHKRHCDSHLALWMTSSGRSQQPHHDDIHVAQGESQVVNRPPVNSHHTVRHVTVWSLGLSQTFR